jgi:hypothetical protein
MTIRGKVSLAAAVAAVTLAVTGLYADPPSEVGRLNLISGTVSFQSGSLDEWAPATLNYPLTTGDHIWTDEGGRAEIHVGSSAIRLDSNTDFSFLNLDDQAVQIRLGEGSLNVRVRDLDLGSTFEVDTPNASVQLTSIGSYRVDVEENGDTSVIIRQGSADATAAGDTFDVPAGQSATVSGTDSIAYYTTDAPAMDEWDAWCAARDQREDQFASIRYVPRTMIGAEDLDDFGSWSVAAGYGTVWVPRVSVGWAPYRFGHWAWVEPWGWTWIDDAPWGFAPFHYGRWASLGGRWVWIPGAVVARPVYAPALVVFVGGNGWNPAGGSEIGWFPLGPREVYIPPYAVSTTYVQRINVTHVTNITIESIQRIDVQRVQYVNRMVPEAVTVVPQQSFAQGRPLSGAFIRVAPSQVLRAPVMGMRATVVPRRESVAASVAPGAFVPQPRPELQQKRVYSRTAPPPAPVPFAARQQALSAQPGRPLDPEELSNLQRAQPRRPPTVNFVGPSNRQPQQGQQNPPPPPPQSGVQRVSPQQGQGRGQPQSGASNAQSGDAANLIASLKGQALPQAHQHLAAAKGRKLDSSALSRQLAAAQATLAAAEKDLAAGNSAAAMQKAAIAQKQISDVESAIAASLQAGGSDDRSQGGDRGQGKDRGQGND